MFNPVPVGKRTRYSYARIKEVMEMPHLLDIQRNSYQWFLDKGLQEIFHDISPIQDFSGNLVLSFESFSLGEPKYDLDECKERDVTLAAPLRVNVRLINRETGEIKEQEVFMGDFPLMTDTGTFIINGAERVIVSQLVRSPGAYYGEEIDPTGKHLYNATVIPNRGAWIELETDTNDVVSVRIDRTRKMPVTYFIRALGFDTDEKIIELFGDDPRMLNTIERDGEDVKSQGKAVIEIYKRLRPGEPANEDNATQLLNSLFFDPKRYDLATVGRYKLTKKLGWKRRILGKVLAEPIVDHETGEIVIPQGEVVTEDMLDAVDVEREKQLFGEGNLITLFLLKKDGTKVRLLCSPTLDIHDRTITKNDILASISYLLNLMDGFGTTDDIDHLGNRRVRAVGELLQNQFRIGLSRMERVVREGMSMSSRRRHSSTSVLSLLLSRNSLVPPSSRSSWTSTTRCPSSRISAVSRLSARAVFLVSAQASKSAMSTTPTTAACAQLSPQKARISASSVLWPRTRASTSSASWRRRTVASTRRTTA